MMILTEFDLYYWQPYWWVWFTDTQPTNRGYPPPPDGAFPRRLQQQEASAASRQTLPSSAHIQLCVSCPSSPVVTICTASLTFSNSTFSPHSVFMCFVWISEQTAIISLYSINWLVCITETECVYCAVRTGSDQQTQWPAENNNFIFC